MASADQRPWIKLSIDYLDNPKIDSLSDEGILLHLALILKSAQQKTDGIVSSRTAGQRGKPVLKELIDAGLLVKVDAKTYRIHDYEKHQTGANIVKKRASAGAIGAHKTNHVLKQKFAANCEHCQKDKAEGATWLINTGVSLIR